MSHGTCKTSNKRPHANSLSCHYSADHTLSGFASESQWSSAHSCVTLPALVLPSRYHQLYKKGNAFNSIESTSTLCQPPRRDTVTFTSINYTSLMWKAVITHEYDDSGQIVRFNIRYTSLACKALPISSNLGSRRNDGKTTVSSTDSLPR